MTDIALITGASSGIGLELAKIHASKKRSLVLVARSQLKLEELKTDLESHYGISVYNIVKDLSQPNAAQEIYDEIKQQNIQIDYLINNAGFGDYGFFVDASWSKTEEMIRVNILVLTQLTSLFLQDMKERKSGKIMNVASVAAFEPGPLMSVYYASKAFVLSFSEALNNEVRHYNISVTALCPGATESGFHERSAFNQSKIVKGKKLPTAKEVAIFGYKAMLQRKVVAVHGFKNKLLIFAIRLIPRCWVVKIVREMQNKATETIINRS